MGNVINSYRGNKKKLIIIISVIVIVIIAFILFFFLVLRSNKKLIVGTWKSNGFSFSEAYQQFTNDGKIINPVTKEDIGTYTIDGDILKISKHRVLSGKDYGVSTANYKIEKLTSETLLLISMENNKVIYSKEEPSKEDIEKYESKMETSLSKSIAQIAYESIHKEAVEKRKKTKNVPKVETKKVVSVESLNGSNNTTFQKVYDAIKSSSKLEGELGFIYIYYDPYSPTYDSFVQWATSESGKNIGQYPAPKENSNIKINFGEKAGEKYTG